MGEVGFGMTPERERLLDSAVRLWMDKINEQRENLVLAVMDSTGLPPEELVLCEEQSPAVKRIWVEPMTQRLRESRIAALNEENAALRARVKELEAELDMEMYARKESE